MAAKIISGLAATALLLGIPTVLRTANTPEPTVSSAPTVETSVPKTTPPSEAAPFNSQQYNHSANDDAGETTAPATEPKENLLNGFTPEQQKKLNIFLSNFAEQGFVKYPAEDDALLRFAWFYCYLNTSHVEDVEHDTRRLAASEVDRVLIRFFGNTIAHRTMGVFEYRNGYYYMPAADGEFYGYCAIAREMYRNEDGTYEVIYDVYKAKWYWEDYVMYYDDVSPYYSLSPDQLSAYPELELQYTGTAVLRDYTRSNGEKSYQVITLD